MGFLERPFLSSHLKRSFYSCATNEKSTQRSIVLSRRPATENMSIIVCVLQTCNCMHERSLGKKTRITTIDTGADHLYHCHGQQERARVRERVLCPRNLRPGRKRRQVSRRKEFTTENFTSPCIHAKRTHSHLAAAANNRSRETILVPLYQANDDTGVGKLRSSIDQPSTSTRRMRETSPHACKRGGGAAPRRPRSRVGHESVSASVQAVELAGDRHYNCRFASSWAMDEYAAQHAGAGAR
jgi:hypothetical protein